MKMEQDPKFQPITLTLESKREAEILWAAVRGYQAKGPVEIGFCQKISDWFSEKAQL